MGYPPDPTDRDTLVDSVDSDAGMLLSLPTHLFPAGATVLNTESVTGYYIILAGSAAEYAISPEGQPDADRLELASKDVIGIANHVRVVALTDLTVAIINSDILAKTTPTVRSKVYAFLLDAGRKRCTESRNRLVELEAAFAQEQMLVSTLETQADSQRLEFEAKLNAKRSEIENKISDNTRLARHVKTIMCELDHKGREVISAATILQLYKEEIDETEETLVGRTKELSELREELASLSGLAPVLERMISSGNKEWANVAQKALTLLYTQGKGRLH